AWTLGLLAGVLAAPATGAGISPGGAFFAVCMVPRGSSSHVQGGRFPWDAVLEHGFIRLTTSGGRRLLVLADARSRRVTSDCHRASAAPTLRVDHLAGPWSGTPSSLVFCGSRTSNRLTAVLTRVR